MGSRIVCRFETVALPMDRLADGQSSRGFQRVSQSGESIANRRSDFPRCANTDLVFEEQLIGAPLMVHPRGRDGFGDATTTVEDSQKNLQGRIDDPGTTGCPGRKDRLSALIQDHRRAHARQRTLAGRDRVGLRTDQSECIGSSRRDAKVIHLVVEHHACARHGHFRTPRGIDGAGHGDPVAFLVSGGQMRRMFAIFSRRRFARI